MNIILIFDDMDEVEKYFQPKLITRVWSKFDTTKKLYDSGLTFRQRRDLFMDDIKNKDFDTCKHLIEKARNWDESKTKVTTPEEIKQWEMLKKITYHLQWE